jgi:hypothetical protein
MVEIESYWWSGSRKKVVPIEKQERELCDYWLHFSYLLYLVMLAQL